MMRLMMTVILKGAGAVLVLFAPALTVVASALGLLGFLVTGVIAASGADPRFPLITMLAISTLFALLPIAIQCAAQMFCRALED